MLTPKKHLNLDISVLRISAIILREIKKHSIIELERLRSLVIRRAGIDADIAFLPALSFVYLLGRIEYHLKNDTVEYVAG